MKKISDYIGKKHMEVWEFKWGAPEEAVEGDTGVVKLTTHSFMIVYATLTHSA